MKELSENGNKRKISVIIQILFIMGTIICMYSIFLPTIKLNPLIIIVFQDIKELINNYGVIGFLMLFLDLDEYSYILDLISNQSGDFIFKEFDAWGLEVIQNIDIYIDKGGLSVIDTLYITNSSVDTLSMIKNGLYQGKVLLSTSNFFTDIFVPNEAINILNNMYDNFITYEGDAYVIIGMLLISVIGIVISGIITIFMYIFKKNCVIPLLPATLTFNILATNIIVSAMNTHCNDEIFLIAWWNWLILLLSWVMYIVWYSICKKSKNKQVESFSINRDKKYCTQCGENISTKATFCHKCGKKQI